MIKCIELNKEFKTKKEMFTALKANKERIIGLKKSRVYKSCQKGAASSGFYAPDVVKNIQGLEKGFIYPVISNTGYVDSHLDVHLKESMNRTVDHQQGKVHYIVNHDLRIGKIIAYPTDVEMMLKEIAWKDLGRDYEGTTQALLFKTNLFDYSNADAAHAIKNKVPVQGSIRMHYKEVSMAMNSTDPAFAEEKAVWDKNIDNIVNQDVVKESGYFYPVAELAIHKEGSMVLQGSNDVTEIIYNENTDPSTDTQEIEGSSEDTLAEAEDQRNKEVKNFYKSLI